MVARSADLKTLLGKLPVLLTGNFWREGEASKPGAFCMTITNYNPTTGAFEARGSDERGASRITGTIQSTSRTVAFQGTYPTLKRKEEARTFNYNGRARVVGRSIGMIGDWNRADKEVKGKWGFDVPIEAYKQGA